MIVRMTSLRLLVALAAASVAAMGTLPAQRSRAAEHDRPPNVVVIVTDDQRAHGTMAVMPATRRWFSAGTRFANAFATTPVCCPSRASIMSGRYAHNHGVRRNVGESGGPEHFDHDESVQRYLRDAGYRTAMFGKFFNQWPLTSDPPYFSRWGLMRGSYFDGDYNVNGRMRHIRRYSTDLLARWSRDFIRDGERNDGRPWYLYVAPVAPHLPATPHWRHARAPIPPWRSNPAVDERNRSDKPSYVRLRRVDLDDVRRDRALQLRSLMAVDDLVRGIARELRRTDEAHNTLVLYLSDNGYLWGEHGWDTKRLPYLQSIQIPMLMRWPAGGVASGTDERLATNVDVTPTILDAAGTGPLAELDGRSLLRPSSRSQVLLEIWGSGPVPTWASLLTHNYQYVEYYADDEDDTPEEREYYDLDADPWQLRNTLGDDSPENDPSSLTLTRLSLELRFARRCSGRTAPVLGCP